MPPEPTFDWTVATRVDPETSKPRVTVSIWYKLEGLETDPATLMATWDMDPEEARSKGRVLHKASDSAEIDSELIMVLRSSKIPEKVIEEVVTRMRGRRMREV